MLLLRDFKPKSDPLAQRSRLLKKKIIKWKKWQLRSVTVLLPSKLSKWHPTRWWSESLSSFCALGPFEPENTARTLNCSSSSRLRLHLSTGVANPAIIQHKKLHNSVKWFEKIQIYFSLHYNKGDLLVKCIHVPHAPPESEIQFPRLSRMALWTRV